MRKEVLRIWARLNELIEDYNGLEAYLGESFCEDELGMVRTANGSKDIDGHVNGTPVQVKFKWVTRENLNTRYIQIKPEADFGAMIITYAHPEGIDVELFGVWSKQQVMSVGKKRSSGYLRVNLKDLGPLSQYDLKARNSCWLAKIMEIQMNPNKTTVLAAI